MAAPVIIAGGATTEGAGGSLLAGESASNFIAVIGVAAGGGLGLAALPSDLVAIGNISLSLAPQGDFFVGNLIYLTAQIDVSYGEIASDGTGGTVKVELIEQGTGVLATKEKPVTSPRDSFSVRFDTKTINHGTKLYYVKVTATGEEDRSSWPFGDTTVTRERESDTISLEVKKPIVISTVLLTPSVSHGQMARALMKVSNLSESKADVLISLDTSQGGKFLIGGKETDLRLIDHKEAHSGNDHEEEIIWYLEPVSFDFHRQLIETSNRLIIYDQIAPAPEILYDPIPITCSGGSNKKIGFIKNHWDKRRVNEGEYAYACAIIDGSDQPLACSAVFSDSYGNSIVATQVNNKLQFQGSLTGQVGTITLTPENSLYQPYSLRVLLDNSFIKELPEKFLFNYAPIPPIKGLVFIKTERLPVQGCSIELKTMNGETIYKTITGEEGRFTVYSNAKNIDGYEYLILSAELPWDITYGWKNQTISKKITREEILSESIHVFHAEVQPSEDWVKVGGKVIVRDQKTRKPTPVQAVEIIIKNELGEIQDNASTDEKGKFSFGVKAGRYFIEITNAVELGYRSVPSKSFTARASKSDVDIWLTLPAPSVYYKSPEVIQIKLPENALAEKLVVLNKGEIVKEYKAMKDTFYIQSKDFEFLEGLEMALMQNGLVGRTVQIGF